ncbi:hypothetical protein ACO0LO_16795 [Undibacterium sp. TJN25]|uniref:hypothetical protein n=1 Tax=Undibacterium sp. TJN25 TaxID=3413056 RepID=UPI003BF0F1D0
MAINDNLPFPTSASIQNGDVTTSATAAADKIASAIPATAAAAKELLDKPVAVAERLVTGTQQTMRQTVDKLADTAASALESLHCTSEKFHVAQQQLLDDCRTQVRKKPVESIVVAAVAGYLLSLLFQRRN